MLTGTADALATQQIYKGSTYTYVSTPYSWDEAALHCRDLGGDLVSARQERRITVCALQPAGEVRVLAWGLCSVGFGKTGGCGRSGGLNGAPNCSREPVAVAGMQVMLVPPPLPTPSV